MACKQVFTSRMPNGSASANNFCGPRLDVGWNSAAIGVPWLVKGTFRNVSITHGAAPGVGKSFVYTFWKNGSPTALVITIADTATTGTDTFHTVSVVPGDLVYWKRVPSAGVPTLSTQRTTVEFWGAVANESGYGSQSLVTGANTFRSALFHAGQLNTGNVGISNHEPVAVAGTVTAVAITLSAAPGASKTHEFVIYKNGVKQDGSGGTPDTRIPITGASATSGSWAGTLTVAAGDWVCIETVPTGTPTGADWGIGVKLVATTDGESQGSALVFFNLPSTTGPYFATPDMYTQTWSGTESAVDAQWDSTVETVIRGLRIRLGTQTVGTGPLTFTMRNGGADTALAATLTIGQSAGQDTTNSFTMTPGDLWSIKYSFSGSPGTARVASIAFVMFALYDPALTGSFAIGSKTRVTASRAVGIGVDGVSRVLSEEGKITLGGNVAVTGYLELADPGVAPSSGTGVARCYIDPADGDFKIVYADGTIKTIVVDT